MAANSSAPRTAIDSSCDLKLATVSPIFCHPGSLSSTTPGFWAYAEFILQAKRVITVNNMSFFIVSSHFVEPIHQKRTCQPAIGTAGSFRRTDKNHRTWHLEFSN